MHVYKSFSKCCFDKLYTNNKVDNNLGRFFSNIYSLIFIEFDNFKLYSETIYAKTSEHKNVSWKYLISQMSRLEICTKRKNERFIIYS
jgi:hypothetical protein